MKHNPSGQEMPAKHYDHIYRGASKYWCHYSESPYLKVWETTLPYIDDGDDVCDLGCGPGQYAEFLLAHRNVNYLGVDFSREAISMARRKQIPSALFFLDNIFNPQPTGDVYVLLEVLEHIEEDIALLNSIPPGVRIIGSVPNYPASNHVRVFTTFGDLVKRYNMLRFIHGHKIPTRGDHFIQLFYAKKKI